MESCFLNGTNKPDEGHQRAWRSERAILRRHHARAANGPNPSYPAIEPRRDLHSKGAANPAWAPAITSAPASVTRGSSYAISGTQFNGLSQGAAYGDDTQSATNYPLVRITNNATKHVFYAKTHNHSSMGVATGTATVSTTMDIPAGMETGASSLVVVANGIASTAVNVTVN